MTRSERLSQQLDELEGEYRAVLTMSLTECAGGRWGLFGHNEHLIPAENLDALQDLRALAQAINRQRGRMGEGPYPLHEEFEAARGRVDPNAPGEPRQAQAWLQRLAGA